MAKEEGCRNKECPVLSSGKCLLDHEDPGDCPDFLGLDQDESDTEHNDEESLDEEDLELPLQQADPLKSRSQLSHGQALDVSEAELLVREEPTRLIVLAGESESGKTTLLAEIFNTFQRGQIGPVRFAGSRSLIGLERRCHLARLESGNANPDTERTKFGDPQAFLPIRVSVNGGSPYELLFTDMHGEHFKRAITSASDARLFPFVARANHLAFVMDGDMMSAGKTRAAARSNVLTLASRFEEVGLLNSSTSIQLVFTKWDRIRVANPELQTEAFIDASLSELVRRVGKGVHSVTKYIVSAREPNHEGIQHLVQEWASIVPPQEVFEETSQYSNRAFGRYKFYEGVDLYA